MNIVFLKRRKSQGLIDSSTIFHVFFVVFYIINYLTLEEYVILLDCDNVDKTRTNAPYFLYKDILFTNAS